jgi:hypothetical protein
MVGLLAGYTISWGVYGVYYGEGNHIIDYGRNFLLGIMCGFIVPIGVLELLYNRYIVKNE